jgi:hypothetical protein
MPSDTTVPVLTSLRLPTTVDLTGGSASVQFAATASDVGSGIRQAVIWLDQPFTTNIGTFGLVGLFGSPDSWSDGESSTTLTANQFNRPGNYHVDHVDLTDNAGNIATYTSSQLAALGMSNSFVVQSPKGDTTAPILTSLKIPASIDLTAGSVSTQFSGAAFDSESGVKQVVIWLDQPLTTNLGTTNLIGLFGISDSWSDGASTSTLTIDQFSRPGTYRIDHVDVTDYLDNKATYTTSQLGNLGLATSFTVQSSGGDTTAPKLISLNIPSVIDLSSGSAAASFSASTSDVGSGVSQVVIWLDHPLTTNIGTFNLVGLFGGADSWTDGTSASTLTVSQSNDSGTYRIDHVDVTDNVNNVTTYTTSQLAALGVKTSFFVQPSTSVTYAPLSGSNVADFIQGTIGNDNVTAFAGNDIINPMAGDDKVDGGAGLDTVVYAGPMKAFAISSAGVEIAVRGPVAFGIDSLTNVERLQFSDGIIAFDTQGNSGDAYRLYQAAFNRTPDVSGLSYWTRGLDRGISISEIAQGFVNSSEFKSVYGSNPTNQQVVDLLYLNVLGRAGEPSGISYWVNGLNNGVPVAEVLRGFSVSAENHALVDPKIVMGISLDLTAALWT